jgi:hypothetical protein
LTGRAAQDYQVKQSIDCFLKCATLPAPEKLKIMHGNADVAAQKELR